MAVLRKNAADKRTAEQRVNDAAQKARPKGAQDTAYVTTGPGTGKADDRDEKPVPPAQENVPVTRVPSGPADGIMDDAGNGPGVE